MHCPLPDLDLITKTMTELATACSLLGCNTQGPGNTKWSGNCSLLQALSWQLTQSSLGWRLIMWNKEYFNILHMCLALPRKAVLMKQMLSHVGYHIIESQAQKVPNQVIPFISLSLSSSLLPPSIRWGRWPCLLIWARVASVVAWFKHQGTHQIT